MRVEQAFYGEYRGGHSLIASSYDHGVSAGIAQRLDLPDTEPQGVEWSPFLRGFPYRDRYVLARTFRDTQATRTGMVFSHALLVRLDELTETQDLKPLLQLLASSDRHCTDAKRLEVARADTQVPHSDELTGVAAALGVGGRMPAVRLGHVGFDDLVVALWANLFPEMRRGFAFRLSFDPCDLVESPSPALVCVPKPMAARWSDYPMVHSAVSREPASLSAAILCGNGAAAPLLEFMRGVGSTPSTFRDLRLAEQAYMLTGGQATLERRIGALRLVDQLSPDSDVGEEQKSALVQEVCELVPLARAEDTLLLRNLHIAGFRSSCRVWQALQEWAARNSYLQNEDVEMLAVLENATTGNAAIQQWQTAVLDGLATAVCSGGSHVFAAFWRWIQLRPMIAAAVFPYFPVETGVEERMVAAMPTKLAAAEAEILATLAMSRGWLCLHGGVLSASRRLTDAVRQQITVDTDSSFMRGLRTVLRNASPAEVVECALEINDPRMPLLAGEVVARTPELLVGLEATAVNAQAIWRESLAINLESWRGPTDPSAMFQSILDRLLDDGEADGLLIALLADTPLADLGSYPRRSEAWSRVTGRARRNLLAATSSGWLREATNTDVPFVPDDTLQSAIVEMEDLDSSLVAMIPDRIRTIVRIVSVLGGYREHRFLGLIDNILLRTNRLTTLDAEAIGHLVLHRRWRRAMRDAVHRHNFGRDDLRPTLQRCYDMLGFWDRLTIGLTPLSESDKWQALESLAAELYPRGPDDLGLWERSGGRDADLLPSGDGRTRWRRALWGMRRGMVPSPSALLAAMLSDYPSNERLDQLVGNAVFRDSLERPPR